MRDLIRAREDMKGIELRARQRLGAFLLRHGRVYAGGRARWTQAHFRWLEAQKLENRTQQIVLQEYVDAVSSARERVSQLATQIHEAVEGWSLRPAVEALRALRGVDILTAATVLTELGDLSRFDNPRQLMAFLGLVPSEHSSGSRPQTGCHHQDGQRTCSARPDRIRLVLSLSGAQDRASAPKGGRYLARGAEAVRVGKRKSACASATSASSPQASPPAKSPPQSRGNWPASCGLSSVLLGKRGTGERAGVQPPDPPRTPQNVQRVPAKEPGPAEVGQENPRNSYVDPAARPGDPRP